MKPELFLFLFIQTFVYAALNDSKLHVLITSIPTTNYVPLLPIAKELIDRGHTVTFAFKPQVYKSIPDDFDARRIMLPGDSKEEIERQQKFRSKLPKVTLPDEIFMPLLLNLPVLSVRWPSKTPNKEPSQYDSLLAQIQALEEHVRPNVILADGFALYGLDVADKLGIPSSVHSILGPLYFSFSRNSPFPKYLLPYPVERMSLSQAAINVIYQQIGVTDFGMKLWGFIRYFGYGLPFVRSWNQISENRLMLMGSAPGFTPSEGLPSRFVYVGGGLMAGGSSSQADKQSGSVIDWLDDKLANNVDVIYAAFGTFYPPSENDIAQSLKGLVNENRAVVWSLKDFEKAKQILPTVLSDELSQNVLITNWAPQKQVLSHPAVKIFFTHGGYNSLTEAVHFGKPLLCRPLVGDQPFNCLRLSDLGAAVGFIRGQVLTALDLKLGVETILENYSQFRQNCEKVGDMFRKTGGAKTAVDALELYFSGLPIQGWKQSKLSFWQRHVRWITFTFWLFVVVVWTYSIWLIVKFSTFLKRKTSLVRVRSKTVKTV
ncbi:hypothetical protein HK098_002866 [Nowakowskiella sp. JEL0407]|nr:hypothetical protein HK098_002866 [Nowakowskiella sp. JEL0407]